ncbi:SWIM zinc finger family protein [Paenibacillus sp. G2S3]|uniref:SWIM zinc finger family protein n=1 Tax=Paenibacillus sp. G2S3 TaxID=3047872 RepID=UPI0024C19509|nr:SWIM zinc finger family protein [Paenibacillus sp. G2S3]WHY17181.1 SWIM zinc finger family protein [Paenibacillus sp. G2S3]
MIDITEVFIDTLAPNSAAIKNGQGLVKKKRFVQLNHSEDGVVLFGECGGSGSSNYYPSADFVVSDKPVMRCTCPSRQIPCKHVLGLLYAYVGKETFVSATIPEDLSVKREKISKREERKSELAAEGANAKPKKVNKSALKKKIGAQLEGLAVLEKLTQSLIRAGLGTIDAKGVKDIQVHVKMMGNYYLTGAQIELRRLALLLSSSDNREKTYSLAVEQLTRIHAFIKKGRAHLTMKLEDPDMSLNHESTIEEWLGHAWQLTELKECGLMSSDVELIQLSFLSYDDEARQEYVDLGYWIEKSTGDIHRTLQYRPYKAAKYIHEEDSFTDVALIPSLYRYPGDWNRRVRFENMSTRPLTNQDVEWIVSKAVHSYSDSFKQIKNQLKNPLADKNPVMLLHVNKISKSQQDQFVITDDSGQHLVLDQIVALEQDTLPLLQYFALEELSDTTMLLMFEHQLDTGRLKAQPLTLIKGMDLIRLLY